MKAQEHKNTRSRRGFTILELIVAMGLFVTVITIAVVSFVNTVKAQQRIGALVAAHANASAAIEQITRELRTGTCFMTFGVGAGIQFRNANGEWVEYETAVDANNWRFIQRSLNGASAFRVTAEDVDVRRLQFVMMAEPLINPCDLVNDGYPPRITILLSIAPTRVPLMTVPLIYLQTTVSARELAE